MSEAQSTAGSQTLDRGLRALELLADAAAPLSISELADQLGVHRSNAYRILRTLEAHRLVLRNDAGLIHLGPRLASLGRSAIPNLQESALPVLSELANTLGMTAFVGVLDADEVITLVTIEPTSTYAAVAQRPGARHPVSLGAPGHAIEASLSAEEHRKIFGDAELSDAARTVIRDGFALSHDEVIPGLTAVAIPLRVPGIAPAALAVVHIGLPGDLDEVAQQLRLSADRIARGTR